jgi:hypothetical protein
MLWNACFQKAYLREGGEKLAAVGHESGHSCSIMHSSSAGVLEKITGTTFTLLLLSYIITRVRIPV